MNQTTFTELYYNPDLAVADIARRFGLPTRVELGIRRGATRRAIRWVPHRGCEKCPLHEPCQAIQQDSEVVGVGCEVVSLDENPNLFERRAVSFYHSPTADQNIILADDWE